MHAVSGSTQTAHASPLPQFMQSKPHSLVQDTSTHLQHAAHVDPHSAHVTEHLIGAHLARKHVNYGHVGVALER